MATHHTLIGVHGRNHTQYHRPDYDVMRIARVEAAKMMIYTPTEVYQRCREINASMHFVVRLGHDGEFGLDEQGRGRHPTPASFVGRNLPDMERVRPFTTRFEIHNEPNHVARYEGWGADVDDARRFGAWYDEVFALLRQHAPWASLGFPGLALHHPGWQGDIPWIEACRAQVERSDWLGCHCYWQGSNMLDKEWGLRFIRYHELFPGKEIEITEFGNSTKNVSDEVMAREYAEYYAELSNYPYVNSAAAFIISSPDPTWDSFAWRKESGDHRAVVRAVGQVDRTPRQVQVQTEAEVLDGPVPLPRVEAIYDQLPVHPSKRYPARSLEEIKLIVIHYTFASGDASPLAIARYQVNQGRAGIGYHYYITEDGTIYQTNRLGVQSEHTNANNHEAVGVALAGKFQTAAPPQAQLASTARLCAYLVAGLRLTVEDLVGRLEVDRDQRSPGPQFLEGVRWKDTLVEQVGSLLSAAGYDAGGDDLAALQRRVRELEDQVRGLQQANHALQMENAGFLALARQLEESVLENERLRGQVADLQEQLAAGNTAVTDALQARIDELAGQLATIQAEGRRLSAERDRLATELGAALSERDQLATELSAAVSQRDRLRIDLKNLQSRVAELETRIEQLLAAGGTGLVEPPPIEDIHATLPTHPTRTYASRDPSTISRLVVHYTYGREDLPPETIAGWQVSRGKPGITYHYLIQGDGTIYLTNQPQTVSEHTSLPEVNASGIGIALAGRFHAATMSPSQVQLEAAAQLCAYLLTAFALPLEAIVGRSELETQEISPGRGWLDGVRWKDTLLGLVTERLPAGLEAELERLKAEVTRLRDELKQTLDQKNAEIAALQQEVEHWKQRAAGTAMLPPPAMIDVVDQLPKHPSKTYDTRKLDAIQWIAVHHSDAPPDLPVERIAAFHIGDSRDWPGIAYHYYILGDGTIYQTNRLETVSYHVGNSNLICVGICLAGRFVKGKDVEPSGAQLRSCSHLVAWLIQELAVPVERVVGHREVPQASTGCPGTEWRSGTQWDQKFYAQVAAAQLGYDLTGLKPLEHYLLFWDHGEQWAAQDFANAADYVARFRPTLGFSVNDASHAQHVTIVGGEAGVSGPDEIRLRDSGCQVHRVAGQDEAETRARLEALVRSGSPYPVTRRLAAARAYEPADHAVPEEWWEDLP